MIGQCADFETKTENIWKLEAARIYRNQHVSDYRPEAFELVT